MLQNLLHSDTIFNEIVYILLIIESIMVIYAVISDIKEYFYSAYKGKHFKPKKRKRRF